MFHDLNVQIAPEARHLAIDCLARLGFDVVAFTTIVSGCKKFPEHILPDPQLAALSHRISNSQFPTVSNKHNRRLTILQRVTIVIDDTSQLGILTSNQLNKFDLVAVHPTSEKLLQQCFSFDFDIISLPMDRRMMFQVKRPHIHLAAEKGMVFEIPYAHALRDVSSRRFLIGNGASIARATGGKHIILSSGATSTMELRGPHDVINLGILFDVPQQASEDAVKKVAQAIVRHGDIRARVHKGTVRIERHKPSEQENNPSGDAAQLRL